MRLPLVIANWKMNGSLAANTVWVKEFIPYLKEIDCRTVVCAPSVYLSQMVSLTEGTSLDIGAQNVNEHACGAYTGEVSAAMLSDIGIRWTIVGHSERRELYGDTDSGVALKAKALIDAGLKPIVCVGETLAQREAKETIAVVTRQLSAVLDIVPAQSLGALAYEPIWAIGTGQTATPQTAQAVHSALRRAVLDFAGDEAAQALPILYGGSVKPNNAVELFAQPDIDGGLIGGAALHAKDFYSICLATKAR